MKFCSNCASPVEFTLLPKQNIPRFYCKNCKTVHYQNPKIVAGCLPIWENKVLLCKRAIEPRYGFWNITAGFMENGETVEEGAKREAMEEAFAEVEIGHLQLVYSIPKVNQVCIFFLAKLKNLDFKVGEETLEAQLFEFDDIPWKDIAFSSSYRCIQTYFEDLENGVQQTHIEHFDYEAYMKKLAQKNKSSSDS